MLQLKRPIDNGAFTPEWHEDGEEDGGWVVKDVGDPGEDAGVLQLPEWAVLIARRAHRGIAHVLIFADFVPEVKLNNALLGSPGSVGL